MTKLIPHSFIDNLLVKTDIVDLINNKIMLKKKGKNYYSHCPFHNEKTPSFTVNRNKQFYYCFGCGTHGNAIDFLMNYYNLNFIEAIEELAFIHGIKIPYKKNNNLNKKQYNQDLFQLMHDINKYYQHSLNNTSSYNAKHYLIQRGLNNEIIHRFSIGFAPNSRDNLVKCFKKNNEKNCKQLNNTGMVVNNNGCIYDRFRNRIMFPIRDRRGRVIAFGGRVIDNTLPKYLNSPETEIFHKRHQLYGLYEAKQNNLSFSKLLVVEGYMDVISLAQFGISYAVASLGTSITTEHIKLLFQTTNTVICCYDGDTAGYNAAWKMLKIALPYLNSNHQLRFMILPSGEDPDSLIRKEGKTSFERRIDKSYSFSKFLFDTLIAIVNLTSDEGKAKFNHLAITLIKRVSDDALKLYLAQKLSKFIGIPDVSYILAMIKKGSLEKTNYHTKKTKLTTTQILITLLLKNPNFVTLIPNLDSIKHFKLPGLMLFLELIELCKSNINITTGQLLEYYRNNKFVNKQLEKLIIWNDIEIKEAEKMFKDTLKHLFVTILDERFNFLIAKERTKGLTNEERKEVLLITESKK